MPLSDQYEMFIDEYMCHFNIAKAAKTVGIEQRTAYEIMKKPEVRAEINRIKEERKALNEDKRDQLINALERIAYADMKQFLSWDDNGMCFVDPEKVDGEIISEIGVSTKKQTMSDGEVNESAKKKIKLVDKMKALEILAKHHQLTSDQVNIGKVAIQIIDDIGALRNGETNGSDS